MTDTKRGAGLQAGLGVERNPIAPLDVGLAVTISESERLLQLKPLLPGTVLQLTNDRAPTILTSAPSLPSR